jgi:hypothetical protein
MTESSYLKILTVLVSCLEHEKDWFAESLELDYAAAGNSFEEAINNFRKGLICTIHEYLKSNGNLKEFLKPNLGCEVWHQYYNSEIISSTIVTFSVESFPFKEINFLEIKIIL